MTQPDEARANASKCLSAVACPILLVVVLDLDFALKLPPTRTIYPSHSGWRAVPSNCVVVLKPS